MSALQLVAHGDVRVQDVAVPEIGPTQALVKVAGCGLCRSDLEIKHSRNWPFLPMTFGHETAGRVAATGANVKGFAEGDPVLVYLVWACGRCRACLQGRDNVCMNTRGTPPPCPGVGIDGGMAEYIKVPARFLEPLGSVDPMSAGPLADAGLTAYHAVNGARHRLTPGATAVVLGVGGLGHMALQILRATTAVRIIAVDATPERLAAARRLGADEAFMSGAAVSAIRDLTDGYGADAVFDFVGVQATVDVAMGVVAPDGAVRFAGLGGGAFTYAADPVSPIPWGVDIRRSYAGTRSDQRAVIDLAAAGKISVEAHHYCLEDGPKAFEDLEAGRLTGRAVLVP